VSAIVDALALHKGGCDCRCSRATQRWWYLCKTPMPPFLAMARAISCSVTVSYTHRREQEQVAKDRRHCPVLRRRKEKLAIAALRMPQLLTLILRVMNERTSTSLGWNMEGLSSSVTSSNVRALRLRAARSSRRVVSSASSRPCGKVLVNVGFWRGGVCMFCLAGRWALLRDTSACKICYVLPPGDQLENEK